LQGSFGEITVVWVIMLEGKLVATFWGKELPPSASQYKPKCSHTEDGSNKFN
jgi:hypothetical protein